MKYVIFRRLRRHINTLLVSRPFLCRKTPYIERKSLREIGEVFGGIDYAAVAQRIRRARLSHDPIAARRLINQNIKCLDLIPISPRTSSAVALDGLGNPSGDES